MKPDFIGALVCALWLGAVYMGWRYIVRKTESDFAREGITVGRASWYGEGYRGKTMANGQPFNPDAMTCAAMRWPMGSLLCVQDVDSGAWVIVELTDRGPAEWTGCLIDLSSRAFRRICDPDKGRTMVRVKVLRSGPEGAAQ